MQAVHSHICEVLFLLKSFAELVTPAARKEYLWSRLQLSVYDVALLPGSKITYSASIALRRLWASTAAVLRLGSLYAHGNAIEPEETLPSAKLGIEVGLRASPARNDSSGAGLPEGVDRAGPVETCWGVTLQPQDIHRLECVCKLGCLGLATFLDRTLKERISTTGLGKATLSGIFSIPNAFLVLATRPWSQFLGICAGAVMIAFSFGKWDTFPTGNARYVGLEYRHYKYTNLADSQGRRSPAAPGIQDFGVIHNPRGDCRILHSAAGLFTEEVLGRDSAVPRTVFREGPSIVVSYAEPVRFKGWYMEAPKGGANTSNFQVLASNFEVGHILSASGDVPADEWTMVGGPSWKTFRFGAGLDFDGNAWSPEFRYKMPQSEGTTLFEPFKSVDLEGIPKPMFGYGIGIIMFASAGIMRKMAWVKIALLFGILVNMMLAIFWNGASKSLNLDGMVHGHIFSVVQPVALFIGIVWERPGGNWPMKICFHMAALCSILNYILDSVNWRPLGLFNPVGTGLPLMAMVIWSIFLVSYVSRQIAIRQAHRLVKKDMEVYNELWKQEVEKDTGHISLDHMARVVEMLGLDIIENSSSTAASRQLGRKFLILDPKFAPKTMKTDIAPTFTRQKCLGEDVIFQLINCMSVPYSIDKDNVVDSYDQLFIQSILLHGILRDKIKVWANASQGYLPIIDLEGENHFVKWESAEGDPELCKKVKWPLIKRSSRAVEKLARVYNGDVSRLGDIVRFSLFFDTFTDLTQALGCIVTDFDVKVERVKSRMSLKHDGDATAGYRDVMLNLRLCTKAAAMLGCDTHLCELQLVLKSFGELKTAQGHQRYILYRDLRAE